MRDPKSALGQRETSLEAGRVVSVRFPGVDGDWNSIKSGQRALLNILEAFAAEKSSLEHGQRAMLNILEDFDAEKAGMAGAQRAVLNILDDFSEEKSRLEETQRAVLNILDDFEAEKNKVDLANLQLEKEIEERKRIETEIQGVNTQLFAANKELEAFSYSVSHDLRAPLRTIDGFSHALLEDCADRLDDTGRTHLNRIRAATQRMGLLIDDLLNLSRLSRTEMHTQSVDISALASAIANGLQEGLPRRGVELRIRNGLRTLGDPGLLRVVLENLLGNAWKFTSTHESALIEFGASVSNGKAAFFLRDDVAGFDPASADRLFGAFQRLHSMTEFAGTCICFS